MKKIVRRKLNVKKFLLFIFLFISLIIIIIFLLNYNIIFNEDSLNTISNYVSVFSSETQSNYDIIHLNYNTKYRGIGKRLVQDKNGYFSTFTSIDNKTYIEYKQNGNSSWSKKPYWENTMETDGCGITAISIILSGFGYKNTPEDLRNEFYPVLESSNISFQLSSSFNIKNSDFVFDSVHLNGNYLLTYLEKTNNPIMICVWNKPGNNRFTTDSHYMVLLASDGNDMVYVSNPNRVRRYK